MGRRVRQTQARLGRMESRLAAVLEGPDVGLSVWDPDGRLVGFNPRFKEFYPDAPLKPGVVFEDLIRYTANRGLVQVSDDDDEVERWVSERVERFGTAAHDVLRTPDGRWIEVYTRSTDAGEILLLYSDVTDTRETEATLSDRGHQLERHASDLDLLADVIHAGREESPELAAARMLERVGAWSGWPVGFVHRVVGVGENDTVSFDVMASWYADTDDPGRFAQLRALVEREPRQDSDGIAGRARQTGRVVWVPNVSVDPAVDPDRRAVMTGIRGGLCRAGDPRWTGGGPSSSFCPLTSSRPTPRPRGCSRRSPRCWPGSLPAEPPRDVVDDLVKRSVSVTHRIGVRRRWLHILSEHRTDGRLPLLTDRCFGPASFGRVSSNPARQTEFRLRHRGRYVFRGAVGVGASRTSRAPRRPRTTLAPREPSRRDAGGY